MTASDDGTSSVRWLLRAAVVGSLVFGAVQLAHRPAVGSPTGALRCQSSIDDLTKPNQEFTSAAERDACLRLKRRIVQMVEIVVGVVLVIDVVLGELLLRRAGRSP